MRKLIFNIIGIMYSVGVMATPLSLPDNTEVFLASYSSCEKSLPILQDAFGYRDSGEDMDDSLYLTLAFYDISSIGYPEALRLLHKGHIATAFEVARNANEDGVMFMEKCMARTKFFTKLGSSVVDICGALGVQDDSEPPHQDNVRMFWGQFCEYEK